MKMGICYIARRQAGVFLVHSRMRIEEILTLILVVDLERNVEFRPVRGNLAVRHNEIHFYDFRDANIANSLGSRRYGI